MSKIKLVNENGKIVARDVDTGDIVPIEFGSDAMAQNLDLQDSYDIQNAKAVDAQSVSTDQGTITSLDGTDLQYESVNNEFKASGFQGLNGGEKIQSALDKAESEPGQNVVKVTSQGPDDVSSLGGAISDPDLSQNAWKLTSPISIPGNTLLELDNCYLFLDDGVNDNIIRSKDLLGTQNPNITIKGSNNAIIDGNATGQTDTTDSPLRVGLRLVSVDNITLRDFTLRNTNGWGIKIEDSDNSLVENIRGDMDDSKPNQAIVQNVGPLSNGTIKTIYGSAGDDSVALSAEDTSAMIESGGGGDIEDITIKNVVTDMLGGHRIVRLIAADSYTLAGVELENIRHTGSETLGSVVEVANGNGSSGTVDNVKNITISDVGGNKQQTIIELGVPMTKVNISNIRGTVTSSIVGVSADKMIDLTIKDVHATFDGSFPSYLFNFRDSSPGLTISDFVIKSNVDPATDSELRAFNFEGTVERTSIYDGSIETVGTGFYADSALIQTTLLRIDNVEFDNVGTPWDVNVDGVLQNGIASESAIAETPQLSYEVGDKVDFTDTGDGSGSGVYQLLPDGTWSQIGST